MEEFSGLFKKMCKTAELIQRKWEPEEWDSYCEKGDCDDGFVKDVHLNMISKEDLKKNYIWLPKHYEIRERLFPMFAGGAVKIIESIEKQFSEFIKDNIEQVQSHFSEKPDNIMNVLAVLFVMECRSPKVWNFDTEEWTKTQNN